MYEALLAIVCCIFLAGAYSGLETGCYLISFPMSQKSQSPCCMNMSLVVKTRVRFSR